MSDWVTFDAQVEAMPWGRSIYSVLPLPDHVLDALTPPNPRRVWCEIAERTVNLAVTRAPVIDTAFLYVSKTLLRETGVQPGDVFETRLRAAPANEVETPDDVKAALSAAGEMEAWTALSSGKRRSALHHIEAARTAPTRGKRIGTLIVELKAAYT